MFRSAGESGQERVVVEDVEQAVFQHAGGKSNKKTAG
jgi:hypothetical protein